MSLGLKLWSTNRSYLPPARDLFAQGLCDYVELYVVPGSAREYRDAWKGLNVPYLLHAPHSRGGLNPSLREKESDNLRALEDVALFTEALSPRFVIFHPGIDGTIEETIRQFLLFRRRAPEVFRNALVENKPAVGLEDEQCVGSQPSEIRRIMEETGMRFCLDFGHAIKYATARGLPIDKALDEFGLLNPPVFHLSDGHQDQVRDEHLRLGTGDFPLSALLGRVPRDSYLTLETEKESQENLESTARDFQYVRKMGDWEVGGMGGKSIPVSGESPIPPVPHPPVFDQRSRK